MLLILYSVLLPAYLQHRWQQQQKYIDVSVTHQIIVFREMQHNCLFYFFSYIFFLACSSQLPKVRSVNHRYILQQSISDLTLPWTMCHHSLSEKSEEREECNVFSEPDKTANIWDCEVLKRNNNWKVLLFIVT